MGHRWVMSVILSNAKSLKVFSNTYGRSRICTHRGLMILIWYDLCVLSRELAWKKIKKSPHAACISTTAWPADAKWRRHTADTWTSTGESELTQWKVLLPQLSQLRAGKFAKYWKFRWMLYMELMMRGRKLSACGNFDAFGPTVTY